MFVVMIELFRIPGHGNRCRQPSFRRALGSVDRGSSGCRVARMHLQNDFCIWRKPNMYWKIERGQGNRSSDVMGMEWDIYLLSSVLLLECVRAGLCGGRLLGPSMLRDIIELRLLLLAVSSTSSAVMPPKDLVMRLLGPHLWPGVLEAE